MKLVDNMMRMYFLDNKAYFEANPEDVKIAFKAGYQHAIERIIFLRHLEAIDGHCSKVLLDDLNKEVEDENSW